MDKYQKALLRRAASLQLDPRRAPSAEELTKISAALGVLPTPRIQRHIRTFYAKFFATNDIIEYGGKDEALWPLWTTSWLRADWDGDVRPPQGASWTHRRRRDRTPSAPVTQPSLERSYKPSDPEVDKIGTAQGWVQRRRSKKEQGSQKTRKIAPVSVPHVSTEEQVSTDNAIRSAQEEKEVLEQLLGLVLDHVDMVTIRLEKLAITADVSRTQAETTEPGKGGQAGGEAAE